VAFGHTMFLINFWNGMSTTYNAFMLLSRIKLTRLFKVNPNLLLIQASKLFQRKLDV